MAAEEGSSFEVQFCLAGDSKKFGGKVGGYCLLLQGMLRIVDCDVAWSLLMVVLGCVGRRSVDRAGHL